MNKLSDRIYSLNLGVPKEFEDISAYSAFLGNGAVGLEKRITELETELAQANATILDQKINVKYHQKENERLREALQEIVDMMGTNADYTKVAEQALNGTG